jgi:alpha-1,6-mannosyltransferase
MHLVDVTMFWSGESGGVQRYLRAKNAHLANHPEIRHTIVVPGTFTADPPQVPGIPLPFSAGYRLPRNRSSVQRVLRSLKPDVIEAGDPYQLAWAALRTGGELGVPVTAFYHSDLPELAARAFGEYGRIAAASYVKRLYRRFNLVFAPSLHVANRLADLGIEHVALQPLGVDTRLFDPVKRSPEWRCANGISPDARMLLYVGRYATEKNLPVLVEAVAKLGAPYVLVTIGAGPHLPSGNRLIVLPYESDMDSLAAAYASADAFVHAGDQETFGLAVLEALASGVPVVGCKLGGIAELVDGSVGEAVKHCDAREFADAIEAVFERDRAVLSSQARERALRYDWQTVLRSLDAKYLTLASERVLAPYGAKRAA